MATQLRGIGRASIVAARVSAVVVALLLVSCATESRGGREAGDPTSVAPTFPGAVPTAGCDRPDVSLDTTLDGRFTSAGVERTYALTLPHLDSTQPAPLVVDVHGFGETAAGHRDNTRMAALGEREGFVTVMPRSLREVSMLAVSRDHADVQYVLDLIGMLEEQLCLDASRYYLTGYSSGGMLTALLACTHADRFAAAAPVAGVVPIADCAPSRGVPVRAFHGTADPVASFDGGVGGGLPVLEAIHGAEAVARGIAPDSAGSVDVSAFTENPPGVVEVMTSWAVRNGCTERYAEAAVADGVRSLTWEGCPSDASVELYVVDGGGHTWPGSRAPSADERHLGPTTFEIDATDLIWRFFEQFHR